MCLAGPVANAIEVLNAKLRRAVRASMLLSILMLAAHPGGQQGGVFIDKKRLGWMSAVAAVVG
jgi:hypothetical protein